jgi:hypothetical protein
MAVQIQLRGGTLTEWTTANPVIAAREMVLETNTNKFKIGNGVDNYLQLPYGGLVGPQGQTGATGAQGAQGFDIYVSDTAPTTGESTWFDSSSGVVYVKYDGAWVAVSGPAGPVGATGSTGAAGATGATGAKGDTGNTGPTGATGPSGVISVSAPLINTGTSTSAALSFDNTQFTNVAGKNVILNGGFDLWQRGTSFSPPTSFSFTADRWIPGFNGTATRVISRQAHPLGVATTLGQERQYFLRYEQTTAGTGGTFNLLQTRIEDVRVLAGQTATFSFWAKAASNTTLPRVVLEQAFGTGGSTTVGTEFATNLAVTTAWQRFAYTFTVPSISGKTIGTATTNVSLTISIWFPSNQTFAVDLDGVKLEAGSVGTPFALAGGTVNTEQILCDRYAQRITAGSINASFAEGVAYATNTALVFVKLRGPMRNNPSSVAFSSLNDLRLFDGVTGHTVTSLAISTTQTSRDVVALVVGVAATPLTAFRPYSLQANSNSAAYLQFETEVV